MSLDLFGLLSKFKSANDRKSDAAYYGIHTPWIGPLAYLHIIFKPAPDDVLAGAAQKLAMPISLKEFLAKHNGVMLFSDALRVYGVRRPQQSVKREDPFFDLPYDIEKSYHSPNHYPDCFLEFGG